MSSEFDLIARHFTRPAPTARLGVGDDAALLGCTPGMELAVSSDMLVAGTHFLADADPLSLGHKTLAVNLSDMAAMGAVPRWVLLSLSLPEADDAWLAAFSQGFFGLAARFGVELVGGDTTRGHLNLCVTILGEVPAGQALRRDGARPGDDIWVSGELGGAALGLRHLLRDAELDPEAAGACLARLQRPEPRVPLGLALRGLASAAIDISDGLLADLGHILERSGVAAELDYPSLPAAPAVAARLPAPPVMACLLGGGDDYELCFTVPPGQAAAVRVAGQAAGVALSRVGRITAGAGLRLLDAYGREMALPARGFDHFGAEHAA
ncbi:MAG TPA: thiamine-phosphate kinase [Thiobacillaceae bacterium]|nr:thiamine-phosphate kinase [Thiobacillaceae bacterium]